MATLKEVYQINERADFQYIATDLISKYKLRSKVKFKSGSGKADYDWMTDTINLRPSYSNIKDFIITVLHEIKHALAVNKGKDFHDDNKFEKTAEEWGKSEYRKWKNKF